MDFSISDVSTYASSHEEPRTEYDSSLHSLSTESSRFRKPIRRNRLKRKRTTILWTRGGRHSRRYRSSSNQSAHSVSTLYPAEINSRYEINSGDSVIPSVPSSVSIARRRHIMESKGALSCPPVATIICVMFVFAFIFREYFQVYKEEDVYVSWDTVVTKKQYWRLFVAQIFHFSKLNMMINCVTLYTVGRYLERKVTGIAMFLVVLVMSVATQLIYILMQSLMCNEPRWEFTYGFGNVIYSLRVLLAYALEPRNYEKDIVYGLYPMVVSASHAPWQPILDLIIFKIVLPEHCIVGQLSGIIAGFLVTGALLLWPTEGVYIANPPYYWTMMGASDPNSRRDSDGGDEEFWKVRTYTNDDFWFPNPSGSTQPSTYTSKINMPDEHQQQFNNQTNLQPPQENSMQRRSDEAKRAITDFFDHPADSIVKLVTSIISGDVQSETRDRTYLTTDDENESSDENIADPTDAHIHSVRSMEINSEDERSDTTVDSHQRSVRSTPAFSRLPLDVGVRRRSNNFETVQLCNQRFL